MPPAPADLAGADLREEEGDMEILTVLDLEFLSAVAILTMICVLAGVGIAAILDWFFPPHL